MALPQPSIHRMVAAITNLTTHPISISIPAGFAGTTINAQVWKI